MEKYEILGSIAKGGYGEVFRGRDCLDGSFVVIKRVPYGFMDDSVPSLVIREISVLKELNHDNIVRRYMFASVSIFLDLLKWKRERFCSRESQSWGAARRANLSSVRAEFIESVVAKFPLVY
ncbi:hypothetical protein OROHE_000941 [Orobanche hederae]